MGTLYYNFSRPYEYNIDNTDTNFQDLIETMLVPANPSTSNWYKSLTIFQNSRAKNAKEFLKELIGNVYNNKVSPEAADVMFQGPLTIRQCPGVKDLLNRSFLIKCPTDVYLTLSDDKEFVTQSLSSDQSICKVDSHPKQQWQPNNQHNYFEGKINLKFSLDVSVSTSNNIPWIFTQPMYHGNPPFTVIPGMIAKPYSNGTGLIINTFIDANDVDKDGGLFIKSGTPIAYMVFPEKMNLKYSNRKNGFGFKLSYSRPRFMFNK